MGPGVGLESLQQGISMEVNKELDTRGLNCPLPILKAKKALADMSSGQTLKVVATDPGSVPDFQGWAKTAKHALLREQRTEKDEAGKDLYVHLLERI